MRKAILTMVLVGLLALPVAAQFGMFRGGGNVTGDALLMNKGVQKELKLSEKETEALATLRTEAFSGVKEAFQDGFEEGMKAMEKAQKELSKSLAKFKEKNLTKDQKKRFAEIEYHVAAQTNDLAFLKRQEVQKALKFTDKQKKLVTTTEEGLGKDLKEVQDDLKESKDFRAAFKKMGELRKEAYETVTKTFDDDQKKLWKEQGGKEFKYEADNPFGKGKGKGFGKKKKDDD